MTWMQRVSGEEGHCHGLNPHACVHGQSFHSCLTLCDLMDYSPPGSSVRGILQARTLEWVAISFSAFCVAHELSTAFVFLNV